MQACTSQCEQEQTSGANDRSLQDISSINASQLHNGSKTHGCAKRGGRPVTWIGGGGLDPKKLAGLGVPVLRDLFKQVFGENTASNNAGWLRRKLSESPDSVHGQCRSHVVRARDSGAAIWNKPLIMLGEGEAGDAAAAAAEAEGQGEAGGFAGGLQGAVFVKQEEDVVMQDATGTALQGCVKPPQQHVHRSLKRSCTEASQNFRARAAAARCPSPSASGSASPATTHQDGCMSPHTGTNSHKQQQHRHHHKQHKQQRSSAQQQPNCSGSMPGHVIHPDELADEWVGCQVMVYWPADNRWWAATICGLSTATQQLQLLYSDQTEEVLAGHDFCELLRNGHLALAAGQAPPPNSATGYTISTRDSPSAAACGAAMLPGLAMPADLAAAAAEAGDDAFEGLTSLARRVQSCQLPASLAGSGSMASQQEFTRSASLSFGVKCGGSGVNFSAARISVSGSGSGSGTGVDFEELAAKRMCCEASINNSGSDGSNPAEVSGFPGFYGASGACMAAAEQQQQQQQQGPQAAQLGAWFASQQRQQQQLQLQMQANLQLQQQVQMQIQHQVAAHMSMQQAAGQVMQLQQPALSSPFAAVGSPVAAAGFAGMPADLGSPYAGVAGYSATHTAAAAAAAAAMAAVAANAASPTVGMPCQQLQQLNLQQLRQSASPVAAAAPAAVISALPMMQQQVQQQQFAGSNAAPKPCDHVVPEIEPQAHEHNVQQQQQACTAPAAPAAPAPAAAVVAGPSAFRMPQLNLQVPAGALQPTSANEIDSLLTKAGRELFELDELAAAGIDSINGIDDMEDMEDDAIAAACGLDSAGDALGGGDACSSGNNSSLCESVVDELAVAGLEAEDAAGYYMFGGAGSPRPGQQQQQQAVQQCAAAAAAAAGAEPCQGMGYPASIQGVTGTAAACGNASQLAGNGFKVSQAPCESSFAHMFDFY